MSYVLRRITEEDEEYFLKCGVKSPFGGTPSYGYYIIENIEEDIKMALMGGQGIMDEEGKEWSEMAQYCAVVWNEKSYVVEFYSHSNCVDKNEKNDIFRVLYKIKFVYSQKCGAKKREEFIEKVKECFITYNNKRYKDSVCEKVSFMDTEVRWR